MRSNSDFHPSSLSLHPSLDFAGYAHPVEGLGPGKRLIIWLRGCTRRCPGCLSPEHWEPGTPIPTAAVATELAPLLLSVDGFTISGGEPFTQAAELCELIDQLRETADLEVLVYTGYLLEELQQQGGDAAALLQRIDLLIDGPYRQELPNTLQWRGSDNQRVHLLSAAAQRYAGQTEQLMPEHRPLQVQMLTASSYRIIGIPHRDTLEKYRQLLHERGMTVEE